MSLKISEFLKGEIECEGLLECINDLKSLDRKIYFLLLEEQKNMSVDSIAEEIERERSTAYRSVKRLQREGLVTQQKENYEEASYRHVYSAVKAEKVAEKMEDQFQELQNQMEDLINEFRNKYVS
ncbi:MAG: helix-turn-helix domain-containing protein [Candidatus Nanohalobium sp.]